jgi:acyl carrier protein
MSEENVRSRLRDFIEGRFPQVRERRLADDDSLLQTGAIDSLGILDLARFVENELAVPLADDDLAPENFDSISSLARFLEMKRAA